MKEYLLKNEKDDRRNRQEKKYRLLKGISYRNKNLQFKARNEVLLAKLYPFRFKKSIK